MAAMTERHFCEWCATEVLPSCATLLGMEKLAALKNIEDPVTLRFCGDRCKTKWLTKLKHHEWAEHGSMCMCARCLGRT